MITTRKSFMGRKGISWASMTSFIKTLDAGILLIFLYMLVTFLCVFLRFFTPATANASQPARLDIKTEQGLSTIREGQLLLEIDDKGSFAPAPLLKTRANLQITGIVANVQVFQDFTNPTAKWLEGIYVFPLPDDAAVYHLRMHIGERIIEGLVKEREEAKKVYEKKKEEGHKASLLEQERPNIFRISVANIGPHEQLSVEIIYQQKVLYENERFSLRFPTVVGPRYIPDPARTVEYGTTGSEPLIADIKDMKRIISPVVEPGEMPVNPVSIKVNLNAGVPLAEIKSLYHGVYITDNDDGSRDITLSGSRVVADRDFVLEWNPRPDGKPHAVLFAEEIDGENYGLLMVIPPKADVQLDKSIARTITFVLDTSGSMAGASEQQAKYALQTAISRLTPEDKFNIITFNNSPTLLFEEPVLATYKTIQKANYFLKNVASEGGTEMHPALVSALTENKVDNDELQQIILITDGCVGNEGNLLHLINKKLGSRRLFTVGIGSAPNDYFMKAAARMGRGSFTFIGDPKEAQTRMLELFKKLENPVLTDIEMVLSQTLMEAFPDPIPDLYQGEPVTAVFKIDELPDEILLHGLIEGREWKTKLDIDDTQFKNGIAVLWAREKIRGLMDSLSVGAKKEQVRTEVLETALDHNLVSRYTSMLAVDTTPTRPMKKSLRKTMATTNLPDGWIYNKVFQMPQTATIADLCFVLGLLSLFLTALISLLLITDRRSKK